MKFSLIIIIYCVMISPHLSFADINNETKLNEPILVIETDESLTDQNDQTNLKILNEIKDTLIANQKQDEKAQLMYTIAQVSGIFIAILGGFVTTKLFTVTTDKNRLSSQIEELKMEMESKNKIIDYYTTRRNQIGMSWANDSIDRFIRNLDFDIKIPNSVDSLIELFTSKELHEPDEYELEILKRDYESIVKRIKDNHASSNLLRSLENVIHFPKITPQWQIDEYHNAENALMHEKNELTSLDTLKKQYETTLRYITLPHSFAKIIFILFSSALIGIAFPLAIIPNIENLGEFYTVVGITCFFASMIITLSFIAQEITSELKIKSKPKNPQPSKP